MNPLRNLPLLLGPLRFRFPEPLEHGPLALPLLRCGTAGVLLWQCEARRGHHFEAVEVGNELVRNEGYQKIIQSRTIFVLKPLVLGDPFQENPPEMDDLEVGNG